MGSQPLRLQVCEKYIQMSIKQGKERQDVVQLSGMIRLIHSVMVKTRLQDGKLDNPYER
jgi:hypothetical protein